MIGQSSRRDLSKDFWDYGQIRKRLAIVPAMRLREMAMIKSFRALGSSPQTTNTANKQTVLGDIRSLSLAKPALDGILTSPVNITNDP
jgi:hypothetical protein